MTLYVPGDPKATNYVQTLNTIAGLVERPSKMYLTSGDWGMVVDELDAQYMDCLMDKTKPAPWHGNRPIQIGPLLVINAETENRVTVNLRNQNEPGAIDFQDKKERLRIG